MFFVQRSVVVAAVLTLSSTVMAFPVNDGQQANWRQGQTTWDDGFVDANVDPFFGAQPTSPTSMFGPGDVLHVPEEQLVFVADTLNRRVLAFDAGGGSTFQGSPLFVLGQPDMETGGADPRNPYGHSNTPNADMGCDEGVNACGLRRPFALAYDARNARLFVADPDNRRVVVWDLSDGRKDGMPAKWVLGQKSMTTDAINGDCASGKDSETNACGLGFPQGLAFDSKNEYLFVADSLNHRVVVFDTSMLESGMSALTVLGQPGFEAGEANAACEGQGSIGTNRCGLADPGSLAFDATNGHLYVSDFQNHRVVRFDSFKASEASVVIGQQDFNGSAFDAGCRGESDGRVNACGLGMFGSSIALSAADLFITDSSNHRVLRFALTDLKSGMAANSVLGQRDFVTGFNGVEPDLGGATSRRGLVTPQGLSFDATGDRLLVADVGNHRVMVFGSNVGGAAVESAGDIQASETEKGDDGSVAIAFENTMGHEIVLELPAETSGQGDNAIQTKVGYFNGDANSPGIAIVADLPKGETKSVTLPVVGNRLCIIDEEVAIVAAFPDCGRRYQARIPGAGKCSENSVNGEPGDNPNDPKDEDGRHTVTVCTAEDGKSVTLSGLLHTLVGVVTVPDDDITAEDELENTDQVVHDEQRSGGCQASGGGEAPIGVVLMFGVALIALRRRNISK